MRNFVALLAGTLFGAGLFVGGMTDPSKVIGFLDLFGRWDPSLAFVMGAALCLALPAFHWSQRRGRPILDEVFYLPSRKDLDWELVIGSALFGIGWGIAGLCPGPAVANLGTGAVEVFAFVGAMAAGMWLRQRTPGQSEAPTLAPARLAGRDAVQSE